MKKTIGLLILLVLTTVALLFTNNQKGKVYFIDGENTPLAIRLHYDMGKIELQPWLDEDTGIWYVFLPSYIDTNIIECTTLRAEELYVNGEKKSRDFEWQDNTLYEVVYGENTMQMIFLEDENLSTLFIETESGSNELMRAAKENVEKGYIVSLDSYGNVEYRGNIREFTGHGNAWQYYEKRAYDIKLDNKATLAGLEGGNQWKLIHMSNDGDKSHTKLGYDIADILGAPYTPETLWVNVYFNGEYHGMYLLTTAVRNHDVFKSDEVVMLEKDIPGRYEIEDHVLTEKNNPFVIHKPNMLLMEEEQKEGIKEEVYRIVQGVEDTVESGVVDPKLIDVNSFAIQYLVEEITLNLDGFETSAFFYKLTENSPLCAGPAWDYDGTFGECIQEGDNLVNPAGTALDGEYTELTWYHTLMENPEFLQLVIQKYEEALPRLQELFTDTLDMYAAFTRTAIRNDSIRWDYFKTIPKTGTYQTWENNYRYLKYFSSNRLNALMDRWGIESEKITWEGNGKEHTVRLLYSGQVEEITVPDGKTLDLSTITDLTKEEGYWAKIGYSEEPFSKYLPILEDFDLKLEKEAAVRVEENAKYVEFPLDMYVDRKNCVSVYVIDAKGNIEDVLSAEPFDEDLCFEFSLEETGTVAMYVYADETATMVVDEVVLNY